MFFFGVIKVAKFGVVPVKEQTHVAHRAVTLLGDDNLCGVVDVVQTVLPMRIAFTEFIGGFFRALDRFGTLEIILFTVNEHHNVGVLLDRAGFTKVRKLRTLIVALFDRTR